MSGNTLGLLFTVTSFGEPRPGDRLRGRWLPGNGNRAENPAGAGSPQARHLAHVTQRKGAGYGRKSSRRIRRQDHRYADRPADPAIRISAAGDYSKIAETFRPGHADYTYWQKYGIRDYRGGGEARHAKLVRVAAAPSRRNGCCSVTAS